MALRVSEDMFRKQTNIQTNAVSLFLSLGNMGAEARMMPPLDSVHPLSHYHGPDLVLQLSSHSVSLTLNLALSLSLSLMSFFMRSRLHSPKYNCYKLLAIHLQQVQDPVICELCGVREEAPCRNLAQSNHYRIFAKHCHRKLWDIQSRCAG